MTGSGTELDPYIISTPSDLDAVRTNFNAWYELGNDIDMSGWGNWIPISEGFGGHLDGKGYAIKNLSCQTTGSDWAGIFYHTWGATIQNLGIANCTIITDENGWAGALAGAIFSSIIKNCWSSGSITGVDFAVLGGLIGCAEAIYPWDLPYIKSVVEQCYSTVNIQGGEFSEVGGLIGWRDHCDVIDCFARGNVDGGGIESNSIAGGLIGWGGYGPPEIIKNCYSTGVPSGDPDATGGLIGSSEVETIVTACFWDIEASGKEPRGDYEWGTGLTTAQMKTKSTFTNAGWDFVTIWDKIPTTNDGYPYLRSVVSVTTQAATNIGHTYAVLNGTLTSEAPFFCGFEIGTETGVYTGLVWIPQPVNNAAFAYGLDGLSPETTYYVKAIADLGNTVLEGNEISFTTIATPATFRSYTLRQTDARGKPIFLAEAKAIDSVYRTITYETQLTDNGLATFTKLPSDRPVDIEVRWHKQYRLWENVYEADGGEVETLVDNNHVQNTDDYVKGTPTSVPGSPTEGMVYVG
jgi:hypothetical protein